MNDKNEPALASVVLVPEVERRDDRSLFRRSGAGGNGKFVFRGVAPGAYKLLAFDDVDFDELISRPEVLTHYEDRGESVAVDERGNYTIPLKIIRTAEEP